MICGFQYRCSERVFNVKSCYFLFCFSCPRVACQTCFCFFPVSDETKRLAINTHTGDFWTIIDATWIDNWVDFVMGNMPPPGPISNYHLYDKVVMSGARRKGAQCVRFYFLRGVNIAMVLLCGCLLRLFIQYRAVVQLFVLLLNICV